MGDVMAIISKAVFEKAAGKSPKVGDKLAMDRYVSAAKGLTPLATGGKLYLVTVRPPNEALWLVAVLDHPKSDGTQWVSKPSQVPITDITKLRGKLKFESGKGITAAAGALGMSLQTPRVLTAADAALLDGALPQADGAEPKPGAVPAPAKVDPNTGERAQGSSLLTAVIEDPTNDAPRQIYADSLQARHDPRGELIVIDLALAGPLSIRRRDTLKRQRAELVKAHGRAWWPYKPEYRTNRGFIESIKGTVNQIDAIAGQLFASEPVVELHLTDFVESALDKLVEAPWLRHIRHLVIKGSLGDDGFATLVAAPNAQQLENLNLTHTGITGKAIASLASNLPVCRTLVLTGNTIRDAGIEGLRAWRHLPEIEMLYLSNCGLTGAGVSTLVDAPLPALVKLTLSQNKLDDSVGKMLATKARNLPALRSLELQGAGIGMPALSALDAAKLPNLARIDVRKNRLRPNDVAAMPRFRTL